MPFFQFSEKLIWRSNMFSIKTLQTGVSTTSVHCVSTNWRTSPASSFHYWSRWTATVVQVPVNGWGLRRIKAGGSGLCTDLMLVSRFYRWQAKFAWLMGLINQANLALHEGRSGGLLGLSQSQFHLKSCFLVRKSKFSGWWHWKRKFWRDLDSCHTKNLALKSWRVDQNTLHLCKTRGRDRGQGRTNK